MCMAASASFNTLCNLTEVQLEHLSKWLSCNGEIWGIGPTIVFGSAAALFLYHEIEEAMHTTGDNVRISSMEKTLMTSMLLGMLSLMIHLWVCIMRFFQYYLDTIIRDSPSVILELTSIGILGSELLPLGPLTRFLKQQQPQIHITICWFLSLCYADYVRKRYCRRFNMPYLEHWQTQIHAQAARGVNSTAGAVSSFVGTLQQKLRWFSETPDQQPCNRPEPKYTVKEQRGNSQRLLLTALSTAGEPAASRACPMLIREEYREHVDSFPVESLPRNTVCWDQVTPAKTCAYHPRGTRPPKCLTNLEHTLKKQDAHAQTRPNAAQKNHKALYKKIFGKQ